MVEKLKTIKNMLGSLILGSSDSSEFDSENEEQDNANDNKNDINDDIHDKSHKQRGEYSSDVKQTHKMSDNLIILKNVIEKHVYFKEGKIKQLLTLRQKVQQNLDTFNVYQLYKTKDLAHHHCYFLKCDSFDFDFTFTFFSFEYHSNKNPNHLFDELGRFKFDFISSHVFINIIPSGFEVFGMEKDENGKMKSFISLQKYLHANVNICINELIQNEIVRHMLLNDELRLQFKRISARDLALKGITLLQHANVEHIHTKLHQALSVSKKSQSTSEIKLNKEKENEKTHQSTVTFSLQDDSNESQYGSDSETESDTLEDNDSIHLKFQPTLSKSK